MLIAVPIGMSEEEWNQQSCTLHNGFITYLQQKQAAGIINITAPGSTQVFKFFIYIKVINNINIIIKNLIIFHTKYFCFSECLHSAYVPAM